MDESLFNLLNYLAPKGVAVLDNIADPLSKIFVVTESTNISTVHEAKKLRFFLDNLIAENIIGMPDRPDTYLGEPHPSQGYRWLTDWPIGAWITLNGFNLLRAEKLKREGKDLESSVKKTNLFSRRNNIITPILAASGAIIAGCSLYNTITTQKSQGQKIDKLQTLTSTLTQQAQNQTSQIRSLLKVTAHQDSVIKKFLKK